MLEYFTYKKVKKHKAAKAASEDAKQEAESARLADTSATESGHAHRRHHTHGDEHGQTVIQPDDESYFEELLAGDDGPAPPLPPRLYSRELDWHSDFEDGTPITSQHQQQPPTATSTTDKDNGNGKGKGKEKEVAKEAAEKEPAKKQNRLSAFFTRSKPKQDTLQPSPSATTTPAEEEKEKKDLSKVLDRLNLSVQNNKVISTDSSAALASFTNIFKDLVNGVPTAYDDLMKIIEDKDGTLSKGFDKLPNSFKKLVTQLPDKITSTLGPELLAAAAASQGIKTESGGGMKGMAKKALGPTNLLQLVKKPGAVVGMLRAIVEVLKTRWPAFIGMNVMWGVALSCKFSPSCFSWVYVVGIQLFCDFGRNNMELVTNAT